MSENVSFRFWKNKSFYSILETVAMELDPNVQ